MKSVDKTALSTQENKPEERSTIPILFGISLDVLSAADFVSDFYIISVFIRSRHVIWTCINFTTVMWPFFVSYAPYLNLKLSE
jgi:hypothetical protein